MLEELRTHFKIPLVNGLHLAHQLLGLFRVEAELVKLLDKFNHDAVFANVFVTRDVRVTFKALELTGKVTDQLIV